MQPCCSATSCRNALPETEPRAGGRTGRRLFLALFLLATLTPAQACRSTVPLSEAQKAQADLVFVGRAIAYQPGEPARITFRIEQLVRGQSATETIQVYWQNGNFGEPAALGEFQKYYGIRSEVGVILPQTYNARRKCGPVPAVTGLGQPTTITHCTTGGLPLPFYPADDFAYYDKPWVVGEICSTTFITPAAP